MNDDKQMENLTYNQRYYLKNKEKILEQETKRYHANKEKKKRIPPHLRNFDKFASIK